MFDLYFGFWDLCVNLVIVVFFVMSFNFCFRGVIFFVEFVIRMCVGVVDNVWVVMVIDVIVYIVFLVFGVWV